jgi:hypothetical protein
MEDIDVHGGAGGAHSHRKKKMPRDRERVRFPQRRAIFRCRYCVARILRNSILLCTYRVAASLVLDSFLLFVPCCCCGSLPKMTRSSSSSCGVAWLISHVRFGGYHTTASGGSVWALISFWNFLARSLQPQRKARAGMCGVVDERGS